MQQVVNAAPTPGEGDRVQGMISALVGAGLEGGYLANPRLARVHWQAGDRPLPPPQVSVAGESVLFVDPGEIPADDDVAGLGQALAAGRHGDRDELMVVTAAYSGLRWGELTALTAGQVDPGCPGDRGGPQGGRGRRAPVPGAAEEPQVPQDGLPSPHARRLSARIEQARAEQATGTNPLGLVFPSPTGKHWRSSNFRRNVLKPAYLAAGWRDSGGSGEWTWHSLRHVFCTTALFTWKLDATDISRMAGHANYRITLDMYVGTTAGILDPARTATQ